VVDIVDVDSPADSPVLSEQDQDIGFGLEDSDYPSEYHSIRVAREERSEESYEARNKARNKEVNRNILEMEDSMCHLEN
jgi:hypothetical protein